ASANMGSTFQRMLTEPKWRQKYTQEVNRFVILDHILSSHAANLLTQVQDADMDCYIREHVRLLKKKLTHLRKSIALLSSPDDERKFDPDEELHDLNVATSEDENSKLITEQLQFLSKISADLHKVVQQLVSRTVENEHKESINLTNG